MYWMRSEFVVWVLGHWCKERHCKFSLEWPVARCLMPLRDSIPTSRYLWRPIYSTPHLPFQAKLPMSFLTPTSDPPNSVCKAYTADLKLWPMQAEC